MTPDPRAEPLGYLTPAFSSRLWTMPLRAPREDGMTVMWRGQTPDNPTDLDRGVVTGKNLDWIRQKGDRVFSHKSDINTLRSCQPDTAR